MSENRSNPASIQVICLGMSRTGTSSMSEALNILGFGPCYHMFNLFKEGRNDLPAWFKISNGLGTAKDLDDIFRGYRSILDQPPALFPAELYAAYPDAKFILTTRDPAKWEASMKATMFPSIKALREQDHKTPVQEALASWNDNYYLTKYHRNRLFSHTQQELLDHDERVKQSIPPEKLLVYQVGEGWERLVEFLGVPRPDTQFPHLNDTATFQAVVRGLGIHITTNVQE